MSSNDYGNLGGEMKAMKDGRKNFMADTSKDNAKRASETHRALSQNEADLKASAGKLMGGIQENIAGMKAQTGQLLADAQQFVARISGANAKLSAQTRQVLAPVKAKLGAQHCQMARDAGKMMAGIRKDVGSLKAEAGQILTEAATMMNHLTGASRKRAGAWRDILRTVRGNGQNVSAGISTATAVKKRPAKPKTKPKAKKRTTAKKH